MYRFLNQIFYNHNKFDELSPDQIIEKCCPFMFTVERKRISEIDDLPKIIVEEQITIPQVVGSELNPPIVRNTTTTTTSTSLPVNHRKSSFFYPFKTDTLFWCMYISSHGLNRFQVIGNKYANAELEEKQKIIEFLKKSPEAVKRASSMKVTKSKIQEIMSDLMLNKTTNMWTLIAMCAYYEIGVILVRGKTYMNIGHDIQSKSILLSFNDKNKCGILLEDDPSLEISKIKDECLCIENIEKPLRGISTYKVPDLEKIAQRLAVDVSGLKKPEMYQRIFEKIENETK